MNEWLPKLVELSKENPELEIIPMTHYEVIAEDWGYWRGSVIRVEKDIFWQIDEQMIFGEDDIMEQLEDNLYDPKVELSDEDFNKLVMDEFHKLEKEKEIKEAIFIFIEN